MQIFEQNRTYLLWHDLEWYLVAFNFHVLQKINQKLAMINFLIIIYLIINTSTSMKQDSRNDPNFWSWLVPPSTLFELSKIYHRSCVIKCVPWIDTNSERYTYLTFLAIVWAAIAQTMQKRSFECSMTGCHWPFSDRLDWYKTQLSRRLLLAKFFTGFIKINFK